MYLYICNYKKINIESDYTKFITLNEKKKINSYLKCIDRERCFIEILLLKFLIHNFCKIPISNIVIKRNKYGKPYLENNSNFKFNISHSNELIIVGIDMQNEIGVDIEFIKKINLNNYIKILKESEIRELSQRKNKLDSFYEIWTIKESFCKEEGKGISIIDDNYDIDYKKSQITYKDKILPFKIINYLQYKICICSKKINNLEIIEVNNEEFTKLI